MTSMIYKKACIFGGTGFIGRQIVRLLADDGYTIKVASRVPESAYFLRTAGTVGQIVPIPCDHADETSVRNAVRGCDIVINCIGVLHAKGKGGFAKIHTRLPAGIAAACHAEKVSRFVHISALGCDTGRSAYAKSKFAGEKAVLEKFPAASILRPSIVFGPEDNFFNMFARLSMLLPVLPLIGGGHTKFQPVYVGDVARAAQIAAEHDDCAGRVFELGGPEVLSFRQIYERMFQETGRKRMLISLPWSLARVQGKLFEILPTPPLTSDQVESLKTDNVVTGAAPGLADLGILPTGLDVILPTYLARFRPGGRFADKKRA